MAKIKPKTWVRLEYRYDDCTSNTVEQLITENDNEYIFNSKANGRNSAPKDRATIKVWVPKRNEWCWFWNIKEGTRVPTLRKFFGMSGELFTALIVVDDMEALIAIKNPSDKQAENKYTYCEPFFGMIPTIVKR